MMTSFLRPLTLTAVATLLMIAPLAGTAPSPVDLHAGAADLAARTPSRAATALPGHRAAHRPPAEDRVRPRHQARVPRRQLPRSTARTARRSGSGFLALGQWSTMGRGVFGIAATEVGPQLQRIDASGRIVRKRS